MRCRFGRTATRIGFTPALAHGLNEEFLFFPHPIK
jgi:hypothetical protein